MTNKKFPAAATTGNGRGWSVVYTDYGFVGEDGIEYATVDEAYEADDET